MSQFALIIRPLSRSHGQVLMVVTSISRVSSRVSHARYVLEYGLRAKLPRAVVHTLLQSTPAQYI